MKWVMLKAGGQQKRKIDIVWYRLTEDSIVEQKLKLIRKSKYNARSKNAIETFLSIVVPIFDNKNNNKTTRYIIIY